jgi:microcystin-dependent protein
MSDQFVAEIRLVPFNFAPVGWATCDGQVMPISQNTALFSLLGTNFGGNGVSNFALPDLRGRAPMSFGDGAGLTPRNIGDSGGEEAVTLLMSEIPQHAHPASAVTAAGTSKNPSNNIWAEQRGFQYASSHNTIMATDALQIAGSSLPHENRAPFLTLSFIIALQGIFPSRS